MLLSKRLGDGRWAISPGSSFNLLRLLSSGHSKDEEALRFSELEDCVESGASICDNRGELGVVTVDKSSPWLMVYKCLTVGGTWLRRQGPSAETFACSRCHNSAFGNHIRHEPTKENYLIHLERKEICLIQRSRLRIQWVYYT